MQEFKTGRRPGAIPDAEGGTNLNTKAQRHQESGFRILIVSSGQIHDPNRKCRGGDLNSYGFHHQVLSLARLPIPPPRQGLTIAQNRPVVKDDSQCGLRNADFGIPHSSFRTQHWGYGPTLPEALPANRLCASSESGLSVELFRKIPQAALFVMESLAMLGAAPMQAISPSESPPP